MAVKVRVRDFQSIHDATVEIDGFTVVTGPNNSGKTALQRAMRGPFENTGGTAFVRHNTPKCIVDLEFDDGHTVTWEKGSSSKPAYRVDGGKPIYPGRQVPDEVQALGVRSIPAGGQEVWPQIAPQFSGQVFLIDKPGSVLAEAVADVERVGHLNRALRRVASDQNKASADLRVRQEDLGRHEQHLEFYQGLDAVEAQVADLERKESRVGQLGRARDGLTNIRTRLRSAQDSVVHLQGVDDLQLPLTGTLDEDYTSIQGLTDIQKRLRSARDVVAHLQGVGDLQLPLAGTLDEDYTRIQGLRGLQTRWEGARSRVDRFAGVENIEVPSSKTLDEIQQQVQALRALRVRWELCTQAISRYNGFSDGLRGVSSVAAEGMLLELSEWRELRKKWADTTGEIRSVERGLRTAETEVDQARRGFDEALAEVGACPLCGHAVEVSGDHTALCVSGGSV